MNALAFAVTVGLVALGLVVPAQATAAGTGARWSVSAVSQPTNFAPGGNPGGDQFVVLVTNAGMELANGDPLVEEPLGSGFGQPVSVTDELPAGVEPLPGATGHDELRTLENGEGASFSSDCQVDGEERKVSCSYSGVVPVDD